MNLTYHVVKRHLLNFRSHFYNQFNSPLIKRNIRFKNIHKGERCFILGSGHSITTQDLTKLSGEIVMTQNHFHAHKDIKAIHPKYHVLVPKYQPKEFDNDWIEWLNSMEQRLPEDTIYFMGKNTKYLIEGRPNMLPRCFYVDTGFWPDVMTQAKIDITRIIMTVPTVITECITIALYMGFDKIYLMGFDLDQVCRMDNRDNVRFYGNSPITANKSEKDSEEELCGGSGTDWYNMWAIWHQLNLLKKEAEKRNIQIINITNGGLLNVFKRQNYDEIIK